MEKIWRQIFECSNPTGGCFFKKWLFVFKFQTINKKNFWVVSGMKLLKI